MATEQATHSIPVGCFQSEIDNFDDWIKLFEDAVELATNAPNERKETLFKKWLPLKLDKRTRDLLKNCDTTAVWKDLKIALKALLIDPQEQYNWQTRRTTVLWDGKESFHTLCNRIKRLVDLYDEGANKDQEYFFRFREALPTDYRRAIDLSCDEKKRTIEEAKKIAFQVRYLQADSDPAGTDRLAPDKDLAHMGAAASSFEEYIHQSGRHGGKHSSRDSSSDSDEDSGYPGESHHSQGDCNLQGDTYHREVYDH